MARPAPQDKAQLADLICRLNGAIRDLECYLAQQRNEQRKMARRRECTSPSLAAVERRRSPAKATLM